MIKNVKHILCTKEKHKTRFNNYDPDEPRPQSRRKNDSFTVTIVPLITVYQSVESQLSKRVSTTLYPGNHSRILATVHTYTQYVA